jgi:pyruvyl transferase EpsO
VPEAAKPESVDARCLRELRETLKPLIGGRRVALVDYPHSINSGDHAIWLGEKAFLKAAGAEVAYQCHAFDYRPDALAETVGDGLILMHGGGNFGDLYTLYNEFRLRVLADFPANPVIVLPQQATFLDHAYLNRVRRVLAPRTGPLTLVARDATTQRLFERFFSDLAEIRLAPDMAFALGRQRPLCKPLYDIVWIGRTDGEKAHANDAQTVTGLEDDSLTTVRPKGFVDGLAMDFTARHRPGKVLLTDWYSVVTSGTVVQSLNDMGPDAMSAAYVRRALLLLSMGRLVVTDRLHAHVLCLLLGRPHILMNNLLGKNWNFYETWTRGTPLCRLAPDAAAAWKLAEKTIAALPPGAERFSGWTQNPPPAGEPAEGWPWELVIVD